MRQQFPEAKVVASTLDEYARELLAQAPQLDLPVVRLQYRCPACATTGPRAGGRAGSLLRALRPAALAPL